ncbi:MAG TPA: poly(R)-hydroxyalkanoic acid synthase subunit PhaE [Thermoleophilia bacterium]|nr:poly(R)-hydroxyalkanoic acid synthase subunit PhaE [Thermoleophilia bacterium]
MAETWAEQTQALTEAWIEAQTSLWSDWAASAVKLGATPVPGVGDWAQQWREITRRTLAAWTGASDQPNGPDSVPRQVIERMFAGEESFLGFVDMSLAMLHAVAPKIEVGDEWMELLRRFIDQVKEDTVQGRGAWMHPESLSRATGDISELWRLYVSELERLYGPWVGAYRDAGLNLVEAVRGDRTAARNVYSGFLDAYEATFGRMLAAPAVGYSRETTERLLRGFDAWVDVNRAGVDFQTEITNTGFRAMEALMHRLVEMSEQGAQITSLHEFYDLWLDTAEKAYYELFGTDSFATLQGRFVNASMLFRRRQGELLDEIMADIGLPGRKEVDEVHRHVYDLRIELRYMKRDMAALRRELDALRKSRGEEGGNKEPATPKSKKAKPAAPDAAKARPRSTAGKRTAASSRSRTTTW